MTLAPVAVRWMLRHARPARDSSVARNQDGVAPSGKRARRVTAWARSNQALATPRKRDVDITSVIAVDEDSRAINRSGIR